MVDLTETIIGFSDFFALLTALVPSKSRRLLCHCCYQSGAPVTALKVSERGHEKLKVCKVVDNFCLVIHNCV